jgi:hypothetical protein
MERKEIRVEVTAKNGYHWHHELTGSGALADNEP